MSPAGVVSDQFELVSVYHNCGGIILQKVDATQQEQRHVEP